MTVQLLQVEARQKHTTVPAAVAIDSNSFGALIETAITGLDSTGASAIQFHDVNKPYALKGDAPAGTDMALLPGFACSVPRNRINLLETPFSLQMNLDVTRAANGDSWSLVFVDRRDQEILFTAKVAQPGATSAEAPAADENAADGAPVAESSAPTLADGAAAGAAEDTSGTAPLATVSESAEAAVVD